MSFSSLFVDVTTLPEDGCGFFQLIFLGGTYAYVLMYASNMISDGSELLLLIPSLAGLVGSVVLPVLGAVPDGAIVLFSGIGPDAQQQLSIGIGALAGSTIMLLTAPWFLSVLGGRVTMVNSVAQYKSPKLRTPGYFSWLETGVNLDESVHTGGKLMAVTSISYLIIQIPALFFGGFSTETVGYLEVDYSFTAMLSCLALFVGYLYFQYKIADDDLKKNVRLEQIIEKIQHGDISLRGIILAELASLNVSIGESEKFLKGMNNNSHKEMMELIVKPFFKKYDKDSNNFLSLYELTAVFKDLGENPKPAVLQSIFKEFDSDKNGKIEFDEFVKGITKYICKAADNKDINAAKKNVGDIEMVAAVAKKGDEEKEEEEEMPEEFATLSYEEQQSAIGYKAAWMLTLGTVLVVVFSDPMVDVLNELGARTNIPAFYVSFVLAPLASNASEVIASYNYAQKKTAKSMAISLSALQGACCMNNTFVLGIFMICVYSQHLAWQFFAETLSILFSVLFIALMSMKKSTLC